MAHHAMPNDLREPLQCQSPPVMGSPVTGTPVMPTPAVQVPVVVPQGLAPGQQMAFIAPDGQKVAVSVPEGVGAGSTILVQYQPLQPAASPPPVVATVMLQPPPAAVAAIAAPALPAPAVTVSAEQEDQRLAGERWWLYGFAWAALCCCWAVPIAWLAPVVWLVLTAAFYCQSPQQRAHSPEQRRLANISLFTCATLCTIALLCAVVGGALAIYHAKPLNPFGPEFGPDGPYAPHGPDGHHGHHGPPGPHGDAFDLSRLGAFLRAQAPTSFSSPDSRVVLDTTADRPLASAPPGAFRGLALAEHDLTLSWGPGTSESMLPVMPKLNTTLII